MPSNIPSYLEFFQTYSKDHRARVPHQTLGVGDAIRTDAACLLLSWAETPFSEGKLVGPQEGSFGLLVGGPLTPSAVFGCATHPIRGWLI